MEVGLVKLEFDAIIYLLAYSRIESLHMITSGPLQGQFLYRRTRDMKRLYLKKCSSVLGYSYIYSNDCQNLISDKLDTNVLLSATGGYEPFKRISHTVCKCSKYII